jgi:hypothetical protein
VSNFKDCRGFVIKFVRIKVKLNKKEIDLMCKFKVHKINVKKKVNI